MKSAAKVSSAILVVTALTVALTIGGSTSRARATVRTAALTPTSFTSDFSAMAALKPLAKKGKGNVAVLLPDTQSSARYVSFDAPYLSQALQAAGLSSGQFQVQNAQGSTQTMQTQAEAAITNGATVLVIDPLDSGSGAAIEANAVQQGVKVIDYDRLTLNGKASNYVSFNNVSVGKLLGKGLVDCVSAWNVAKPQVLEMDGDPTDNNATQFAQGYNSVLNPKYKSKTFVKVSEPAGTWDNQKALTNFEQQFTAHPNINAVLAANDGLANSVISSLKNNEVPAKKVPTTGQDATLQGLQNILSNYQCMTVYKPIYTEAQAAVAVAMYLRAGQTPPKSLVNAKSDNKVTQVPSVLLTPISVNTQNMNATVVKDKFVPASDLCAGSLASACSAAGIQP
ncbi:MAG TPA: substrate-binding domain-containing protein [Acidimicrobiia bacterium]|jgi:D-xylose transport system substrate-binding protein|nr:substrate-binding domain-containing protein [Acidimicrobiia bacterium]